MTATDRRSPFAESRRQCDCFPSGGAVMITIGFFSVVSFAIGFLLGVWVM